VRFVQFIDGDCMLQDSWLEAAADTLAGSPRVAIVAGRLRERFPERSIFNRLADLEWNAGGAGEVEAVGGIFMIRRDAFESVGGFDPTVSAGEEPELCQRLRRRGWKCCRLARNMALHDLAMTRFTQWWKRQTRTGYGGLDVLTRFGLPIFRRITWRARFWSAWPFAVALIATLTNHFFGTAAAIIAMLLALSLWPLQWSRIALGAWRDGQPLATACAYGFFSMLAFWPQMAGQFMYWRDRPFRLPAHKARCNAPGTPTE